MDWYTLFDPATSKWLTLGIFALAYAVILWRKITIAYVSLAAAGLLVFLGISDPVTALLHNVNWDVLALYWGYSMLAFAFLKSNVPSLIVNKVLSRIKREKYAVLMLCLMAMLLSAAMPNPVVVVMLAPIAIEMSEKLKGNLFRYMIALAVCANMVTTVSMIADPPALILALTTGMQFLDFYWFQGRIGLGTISFIALGASLLVILFQFRKLSSPVTIPPETIRVAWGPMYIFIASILVLALVPWNSLGPWNHVGIVGLFLGALCLIVAARDGYFKDMLKESDPGTLAFLVGIFICVATIEKVGLLEDFSVWLGSLGLKNTFVYLAVFTWLSVLLSAFIDNVPFTVLMIPVCSGVAEALGTSPWPFYFGMLIGTGIGGNLTPVGATANVLACGILEKRGYTIKLGGFARIAYPLTFSAVMAAFLLIALVWL